MYYHQLIRRLILKLGFSKGALTLVVFLSEPSKLFLAMSQYFLGFLEPFAFYKINPEEISKELAEKRSILLIHGNYHNQAAWLPLAQKLLDANLGPVYSVNLSGGPIKQADIDIINTKIAYIQKQYQKFGKKAEIDIVGHSRGGQLAFWMGFKDFFEKGGRIFFNSKRKRAEIKKIISIGSQRSKKDVSCAILANSKHHLYEITAKHDLVHPEPSHLGRHSHYSVDTGHLGLLYSSKVHEKVIQWLKRHY